MKKLISMFITGAMLLTAFPTVSAAVQTNPGYTTEQPAVKTEVRLRLAQALAFP